MAKRGVHKPELQRLLDLQTFLQKFHYIERITHHPGSHTRLETDTEHSYSLAMTGWFLAQYFPELDRDEIIRLSLAHDLVEIYAGDTFIYGAQADLDSKEQREAEALARIKKEWPDFPEMIQAMEDYKIRATPESKFVYALDKLMPIFMIFLGEGYTWQQEKITLEQLHANKALKVAVSPEITEYYDKLLKLLETHRHYFSQAAT